MNLHQNQHDQLDLSIIDKGIYSTMVRYNFISAYG